MRLLIVVARFLLPYLLRLIHQPVDVPAPIVPPSKGDTMNTNFKSLFAFVMKAAIGVEQLAQVVPASGADKKAAVTQVIQESIDPADTSTIGILLNMISPVVTILNGAHPLFQKAPPLPGPSVVG